MMRPKILPKTKPMYQGKELTFENLVYVDIYIVINLIQYLLSSASQ